MIYSGSGSSSEFSKFRIHIQPSSGSMRIRIRIKPCYLSIFRNCKQNHFKFNHKEESIYYLPFSISKSRIHREITFLLTCSFIFSWIRIRNNNSGSRQKFWIHADPDPNPDPQQWAKQQRKKWRITKNEQKTLRYKYCETVTNQNIIQNRSWAKYKNNNESTRCQGRIQGGGARTPP